MNIENADLIWPVLAYLTGSFPTGLIIVRWVVGVDVRNSGSGNIGATNVRRIAGGGWSLATLILDAVKGLLPVAAATLLSPDDYRQWLAPVTALAAITGHIYPVYLRFKPSGKGVATAMGAYLALSPFAVMIIIPVFILVVKKTRHISAGSLLAAFALPPCIWFIQHEPVLTVSALATMVIIIYRHRENLVRLANGTEPPIGNTPS